MNLKRKKNFIKLFVFVLAVSFLFCLKFSNLTFKVNATGNLEQLNVSYNSAILTIALPNGTAGYQYQYWIKTRVETDNNVTNTVKNQYIWKMVQGFTTETTKSIGVNDNYLCDCKYNIIVRIKDSNNNFIKEVHGVYSPEDVNQVNIESISVDGILGEEIYVVDKSNGNFQINIYGNTAVKTYSIYNENILLQQNSTGIFDIDISSFENGFYDIKIKATNENEVNSAEKEIKIYLYGDYKPDKVAVIKDLVGTSNAIGETLFKMELEYSDGTNILKADIDKFDLSLKSGERIALLTDASNNITTGILEVSFTINYNNKYGIYRTFGCVKRKEIEQSDDNIIVYYSGYAREANVEQQSDAYSAIIGETINISSEGFITGDTGNFLYAYYREDASGWILIKDYSLNNEFIWMPTKSGIYNIQVRIKDEKNGGSYEAIASKVYTIEGMTLQNNVFINIYDYITNDEITTNLIVGRPYKLSAEYDGIENVLYKFLLTNQNLGTIYLSKFTTSPYLIFIPFKIDTYKLTVRIINSENFGYQDKFDSFSINSELFFHKITLVNGDIENIINVYDGKVADLPTDVLGWTEDLDSGEYFNKDTAIKSDMTLYAVKYNNNWNNFENAEDKFSVLGYNDGYCLPIDINTETIQLIDNDSTGKAMRISIDSTQSCRGASIKVDNSIKISDIAWINIRFKKIAVGGVANKWFEFKLGVVSDCNNANDSKINNIYSFNSTTQSTDWSIMTFTYQDIASAIENNKEFGIYLENISFSMPYGGSIVFDIDYIEIVTKNDESLLDFGSNQTKLLVDKVIGTGYYDYWYQGYVDVVSDVNSEDGSVLKAVMNTSNTVTGGQSVGFKINISDIQDINIDDIASITVKWRTDVTNYPGWLRIIINNDIVDNVGSVNASSITSSNYSTKTLGSLSKYSGQKLESIGFTLKDSNKNADLYIDSIIIVMN